VQLIFPRFSVFSDEWISILLEKPIRSFATINYFGEVSPVSPQRELLILGG
jgi:hypothetical protein